MEGNRDSNRATGLPGYSPRFAARGLEEAGRRADQGNMSNTGPSPARPSPVGAMASPGTPARAAEVTCSSAPVPTGPRGRPKADGMPL